MKLKEYRWSDYLPYRKHKEIHEFYEIDRHLAMCESDDTNIPLVAIPYRYLSRKLIVMVGSLYSHWAIDYVGNEGNFFDKKKYLFFRNCNVFPEGVKDIKDYFMLKST